MQSIIIILVMVLLLEPIYLYLTKGNLSEMLQNIQKFEYGNIKIYSFIISYLLMSIILYYSMLRYEFTYLDIFILGLCVNGLHQSMAYGSLNHWDLKLALLNTLWGGILFISVVFLYRNIVLNI